MEHMSGPMWMPHLAPTLARILAQHPQPVPLFPVLCVLLLGLYLAGVIRIRHIGLGWPAGRTVAWVLGVLIMWQATATGIEGYAMVLMSVHMLQHMILTMLVPILLLLGSPVTLALRSLPSSGRASSPRRALVRGLHSRPLAVLISLPVRWFVFLSGLYGIYFTPIFDALMSNVWGHYAMLTHFLVSGLLFFVTLVNADPIPGRSAGGFRLLELFVSTPFHAFFGISVMMATIPIVGFYAHPPAGWGIDVLEDQLRAGGIAWVFTEFTTLIVMGVIFVQWYRSEQRVAARQARATDRGGDDALAEYNAYLADLARHDNSVNTTADTRDMST